MENKNIISTELLSEVLNEDVVRLGSFNNPVLEVEFKRYSYKEWININIHELADKCKEWAFNNGVIDWSLTKMLDCNFIPNEEKIKYCLFVKLENGEIKSYIDFEFSELVKYEIKATDWILDNKETK